jgi:hypothetical protein
LWKVCWNRIYPKLHSADRQIGLILVIGAVCYLIRIM